MIVLRMRNGSEHEELMRKVKKMYKFTKELMEMLDECCEEMEGDELDYREEDEERMMRRSGGSYRGGSYRGRMRRSM